MLFYVLWGTFEVKNSNPHSLKLQRGHHSWADIQYNDTIAYDI